MERRSVEAFDLFRRYAREKEGPLGDEHPEVPKVLAEPLPPAGEVLILGERGSLVLVDERLVGTLPLSAPLLLPAGNIRWCWSWRRDENSRIWTFTRDPAGFCAVPSIQRTLRHRWPRSLCFAALSRARWEAIRQLEQAAEQAAHGSGHILKRREMAMTAAPQLASCLDSLLCQEELGKRNQAEYVLLLHAEHSGLGQQSDWRLHLSVIDVAVGDRAATGTPLCANCTISAAATIGSTLAHLWNRRKRSPKATCKVLSVPSRAEVFVGERKLGITPLNRPAWAGRLPLEVRSPGLPPYQGEVLVEPDRSVSLSIDLGEGGSSDADQQKNRRANRSTSAGGFGRRWCGAGWDFAWAGFWG